MLTLGPTLDIFIEAASLREEMDKNIKNKAKKSCV